MILGVAVVSVLVAHGSDSTPRGYGYQGGVVNERCGGGDTHPPMRRAEPRPAPVELPPVSWTSKLKSREWEAFHVCGFAVEA